MLAGPFDTPEIPAFATRFATSNLAPQPGQIWALGGGRFVELVVLSK